MAKNPGIKYSLLIIFVGGFKLGGAKNPAHCCPKPRKIQSSFLQQSLSIVTRTNFKFHAILDNNVQGLFAPPN